MIPPMLERLVGYDEWANARLLDAVAALDEARQEQPLGGSFGTLRALCAHVVGAEWLWMRRWQGESPMELPGWLESSTVAELRAHLAVIESDREAFLAARTESDWDSWVEYRRLNGDAGRRRLSDLVLHAVNHSTYHRGQIADKLRMLGVAPPSTDLLEYAGL